MIIGCIPLEPIHHDVKIETSAEPLLPANDGGGVRCWAFRLRQTCAYYRCRPGLDGAASETLRLRGKLIHTWMPLK